MKPYRQELVLQLPGNSIRDYDSLIEFEDEIIARLGNIGDVDGHDMGMGEMNIFIRTDHPKLAFDAIKLLPRAKPILSQLKVAYRDVGGDNYTILYPPELSSFSII
jgi:hypothetical protein